MTTQDDRTAIIILAAGLGTRMKSNKAKVLHTLHNRPMIQYVVETANNISKQNVIVVTGHQAEEVKATVLSYTTDVKFAYQEKQLGTGHAVMCALPAIKNNIKEVIILCGDVPLLTSLSLEKLIKSHRENRCDVTVLGVEMNNPTGYGRMITDQDGNLIKIVEEADADSAQKSVKIINSGIYCVDKEFLSHALSLVKSDNAQEEYYLTDIIGIGHQQNRKIGLHIGANANEVMGINSIPDLKAVEKVLDSQKGKKP